MPLINYATKLARALYEREEQAQVGQSVCPSEARFVQVHRRARTSGWSPDEQRHISTCNHCQNTIALLWNMECPSVLTLAEWASNPPNATAGSALQLHVESHDCRRCRLLMRSGLMQSFVALLRGGRLSAETLRSRQEGWAVGYLRVPVGQFAPDIQPGFRFRTVSDDRSLITNLRSRNGHLVGYTETPDRARAGQGVRMELTGERGASHAELLLTDHGEFGAKAAHDFGQFTAVLRDFGTEWAITAVWIE